MDAGYTVTGNMADSVIIYTGVLLALFSCAFIASFRTEPRRNNVVQFITWEILLMLIVFTLVFGLRYNVGIDYPNYEYIYRHPDDRDDLGFLFEGLTNLLVIIDAPPYVFFSLLAFLQFFFLLYSFKNERYLLPFLIVVFICGQYFLLWMNVIRQDLATCIFIFSIKFINEGNFKKYLFWIIVATGFHHTAIVLLLFYPIFRYKADYTIKIPILFQLSALLLCSFIYATNQNLMGEMDELLSLYLADTEFEEYSHGAIFNTTQDSVLGFSFFSAFIIDMLIISYSNQLKDYYHSERFAVFYNLYLVGALLGLLLGNSFILLRPVRYFRFFKLVIAPYLLFYLFKQRNEQIWYRYSYYTILFMYLLQYVAIFFYSSDAMYEYHFILSK